MHSYKPKMSFGTQPNSKIPTQLTIKAKNIAPRVIRTEQDQQTLEIEKVILPRMQIIAEAAISKLRKTEYEDRLRRRRLAKSMEVKHRKARPGVFRIKKKKKEAKKPKIRKKRKKGYELFVGKVGSEGLGSDKNGGGGSEDEEERRAEEARKREEAKRRIQRKNSQVSRERNFQRKLSELKKEEQINYSQAQFHMNKVKREKVKKSKF